MTVAAADLIVIAEAGVNHDGRLDQAIRLVCAAKATGADVVKFQHFHAATLVATNTPTAAYQQGNTGTTNQSELLRALELDIGDFREVARVCREEGIGFLCTAFEPEHAAELVALGMDWLKIPSGDLTNLPLLESYARFGLPVLLSTGMGTLEEVEQAIAVLETKGARDITLLHCTSLYPAPPVTLNLNAMVTMQRRFNRQIGYSDHSDGDHASIAAVALGACVIEKHFTLDRSLPGPDHLASLEPAAFAAMVARLRETRLMLGDGVKRPSPDEIATAKLVRRSWHAARSLPAGHVLASADLTLKRPADGLPPDINPVGWVTISAVAADAPVTTTIARAPA